MQRDKKCFYNDIDIRFYDCDNKKRARLETILRYMSDIGGIYCASKGYTHEWLLEHDFVFLLSRVSLHINRIPKSEERITLETWEREVKGVLFYRDVVFYDMEGNSLIECSTAWVGANPDTHSIVKPSLYQGEILPYPEKTAKCLPVGRLKLDDELFMVGKRKLVYSDIDANNHVYNAVYGGIACDFLEAELMEKNLTDVRINYKQEALLGEEMTIKTRIEKPIDNKITAYVVGELERGASFECEMIFEDK